MLAIGGAVGTDIDGHIQYPTLQDADQLALGVRGFLVMEAPQYAVARTAHIVLDEGDLSHFLLERSLVIALEKISSLVAKDLWLKD